MVWSDSGDTSDFSECSNLPKETNYTPLKRYHCTYENCNLTFSRPLRLTAHIYTHTGEKPFPCSWEGCNKAYTNKSHLSRHVRSVHQKILNTKSYRCTQCNEVFKNSQNLKKHISRSHDRKYPYYCIICNTGFVKKNVLAQHMYYHTGNNPFKCNLCDKTFCELIALNKHKRNHKIYQCFCNEIFTKWSDFVKHKKISHIPSEYICDICKKVFDSRFAIVKHMTYHSTNKIIYQCAYDNCPKFYSSKYNLTFHIKSYHENLTFNCEVEGCNAKLSTKAKLQLHMSKHNTNKVSKKPKQSRQRNKRKDIGSHKRSTATKLLGIKLPAFEEKMLMENHMRSNTDINYSLPNDDLKCVNSMYNLVPIVLNTNVSTKEQE